MKTEIAVAAVVLCAFNIMNGLGATLNEIRIDQPSSDNSEYFELAGAANEPLTGLWYVVLGDTGGGTDGANGFGNSGIVETALDLTGSSIPGDGYFLAAESTFENGAGEVFEGIIPDLVADFSFENSDNVTHMLVNAFTGALDDDLDTNDDGTLDVTPWSSVVDAVGLLETVLPPAASGEDWAYGAALGFTDVGPDGTFVPGHVYRLPNGSGAYRIGGFTLGTDDTPGSANIPEPAAILLLAVTALSVVMLRYRFK